MNVGGTASFTKAPKGKAKVCGGSAVHAEELTHDGGVLLMEAITIN
jgi:hypothetical protein